MHPPPWEGLPNNLNLQVTRTSFCFPSDHFYIILSWITRTIFWALKKSGRKQSTGVRNIEFWISGHWPFLRVYFTTVEPRSTDTRLIRTPALYGQFRLSRQKAHIFSIKLTRFIRTPVYTDNGHFSGSRVTNSHILSTPLYGHWLSAHCPFSLSQLCELMW